MVKILICDPIHPDGPSLMREAGFDVVENSSITAEQLQTCIGGFDAVVVRGRTKITGSVLNAAVKLKVVARSGVGLDNIDVDTAKTKSIRVISTPAAPTTSVAELTIGLMLALIRKISYADRTIKEGKWVKTELMGSELKSKTVGIIGAAGRIGLEVGRIAIQGFGSKVMGYDVIDFKERAQQIGLVVVDNLEGLLGQCDIVSIHVPYLPSTHHLIDEESFSRMKKGAMLVNASRGDIIDGQALLVALKGGKLGGAGLDVFHKEPPIDPWEKDLVSLPNVICTAHVGAQTTECQRLESTQIAEQLVQLFKSQVT
ncbi:MAG TPA: hydroxyacid dehydrogenase [Methylomirabilota bacterium]|nr:hydroxyacid dehydrogenase [Methylomirabilota bacterium]